MERVLKDFGDGAKCRVREVYNKMEYDVHKVVYDFISANIIRMGIEQDGDHGGNSGPGRAGFFKLVFKDMAGTEMYLNDKSVDKFAITFYGTTEVHTLYEMCKMIVEEIDNNWK